MPRNGESTTSENRIASTERQVRALNLRKGGMGYEAIARELGYGGPSGAYKAIMTALHKMLQEPADELRVLECARLDRMLTVVWGKAINGDLRAIDRVLKIMARRAAMIGLDTAVEQKINISMETRAAVQSIAAELGLPEDYVLAEITRGIEEHG